MKKLTEKEIKFFKSCWFEMEEDDFVMVYKDRYDKTDRGITGELTANGILDKEEDYFWIKQEDYQEVCRQCSQTVPLSF